MASREFIAKIHQESPELRNIDFDKVYEYVSSKTVFEDQDYVVYISDGYAHIYVLKEDRRNWFPRKMIRRVCNEWFKENDFLLTFVEKSNHVAQDFIQRIGFVETKEDNKNIFFSLTKERYENVWCK